MQGLSLHTVVFTVTPLQFFPPQDGAGLLHLLVWFVTPLPQVLEQLPLDVQFDQPPLTTQYKNYYFNYN